MASKACERSFPPSASYESENSISSWSRELEHVQKGAPDETETLTDRIWYTGGRCWRYGVWRREGFGVLE